MSIQPYNSWNTQYKSPFGAVPTDTQIIFTIKPPRYIATTKAYLILQMEAGESIQIALNWTDMDGAFDVYTCTFTPKYIGLYWYSFKLETATGSLYISHKENGQGEITEKPTNSWQLTIYEPTFSTPDWLKGGIIYQIFPDRFNKQGDFSPDVPNDRNLRQDWGGVPEYKSFETQTNMNNDYFGGNLKGITSKLDYLSDLGITAIYLNPIFEAHSNHRYNTADYMKIDPLLGTESDFIELCKEAEKRDMHIILDGVFNHTGADSVYFNREGRYAETGAYQSQESQYSGWYDFKNWPNEYRCWWGDKLLPEINEANDTYLNFIFGEDGVLKHWLKAGASGWRLDVADELPTFFLSKLRETVKEANPNAIIIGEVWEDASNKISYGERRHYLEGKELDSVMNYPFKEAIITFMKEHNAEALNNCILNILEHYPKPVVDVLMNILGTHDTERILTRLCGENCEDEDRNSKACKILTKEEKALGLQDVAIAAAILYFLPGIPSLYYGDEIGLEGYTDPFNRGCFLWDKTDSWLTKWYQKIAQIRKNTDAVKAGDYIPLTADGGFFAFIRKGTNQDIILAANLNDTPYTFEIPYPQSNIKIFADLMESTESPMFTIAPKSCKIFQAEKSENT